MVDKLIIVSGKYIKAPVEIWEKMLGDGGVFVILQFVGSIWDLAAETAVSSGNWLCFLIDILVFFSLQIEESIFSFYLTATAPLS